MSNESKAPRTLVDIQTEYSNLAFKAGNLQYELVQRKKNLDMINEVMRDLDSEYVAAKAAQEKSEKQAAPAQGETK